MQHIMGCCCCQHAMTVSDSSFASQLRALRRFRFQSLGPYFSRAHTRRLLCVPLVELFLQVLRGPVVRSGSDVRLDPAYLHQGQLQRAQRARGGQQSAEHAACSCNEVSDCTGERGRGREREGGGGGGASSRAEKHHTYID